MSDSCCKAETEGSRDFFRIASAALPHHRTCGSAYGGSWSARNPLNGVEPRHQAKMVDPWLQVGEVHVCCTFVPPWPPVSRRPTRMIRLEAAWECPRNAQLAVDSPGQQSGPYRLPVRISGWSRTRVPRGWMRSPSRASGCHVPLRLPSNLQSLPPLSSAPGSSVPPRRSRAPLRIPSAISPRCLTSSISSRLHRLP